MADFRQDSEHDLEEFARYITWSDVISYALTLPLLVLLAWWLLQR